MRWWLLLLLVAAGAVRAQDPGPPAAARVAELRGSATAQRAGSAPRRLQSGSTLHVGDRIDTASRSTLKIEFTDATATWLGAGSALSIDSYRQVPDDPAFGASVLKGAFRFATGLIARANPRAVTVRVPTSTIGIRGTHFGGEAGEASAVVILLAPVVPGAANAIEVSNPFGAVVIDQPGFGTEIPDAFSPPGAPRRMQQRAIDNLMRSLQSIQRMQVPRGPR